MALTYEWKVTGVKTRTEDGYDGVVFQTFWQKIGTDEAGLVGTFTGATPIPFSQGTEFTPFDQLTEAEVLSWIQPLVTGQYAAHVDAQIQKQIDAQKADVQDPPLPWAPPEPPPEPPVEPV